MPAAPDPRQNYFRVGKLDAPDIGKLKGLATCRSL